MISSAIRRTVANRITNGQIEKQAAEVLSALAGKNSPYRPNHQFEVLSHAVSRVPHYREYKDCHLNDFPVVNKNDMRTDLEAFLDRNADIRTLSSASTSGSTGIPFTAYFDKDKVMRHRAGLVGSYRFMEADPYGAFVFSRAWSGIGFKKRIVLAAKGHLPFAGVEQDQRSVAEVVKWINRRRKVTLIGYSSYIEGLLRSIEDLGLRIRPESVGAVVGGSEPPSTAFPEDSERVFHVRPKMRYSSMELGVIGVTSGSLDQYHIDTSSYHVEILQEETDLPAEPGESGRIVVTDLYNRAMPFIRYDTGDLGQFYIDSSGVQHPDILTGIKGRRLDVLIGGTQSAPRYLHSLQIWGPTSSIREIRQFQLRQHSIGKFTWVLNANRSDALENQLRHILRDVVGPIEECYFVYVEEVPVLASGKRQFFVNEISTSNG